MIYWPDQKQTLVVQTRGVWFRRDDLPSCVEVQQVEVKTTGKQPAKHASNTKICRPLNNQWAFFSFSSTKCKGTGSNFVRGMIRKVMNLWRDNGKLEMLSKGRDAKWKRSK